MTKQQLLRIAMEQSAEDIGCGWQDFLQSENVIVPFRLGRNARKYLREPITANLVSYGGNVVAAATGEVWEVIAEYIRRYEFYHLFETPNLNWLSERLAEKGHKVCFMAEYFLPDPEKLPFLSCQYELRLLEQRDFAGLYLPQWGNALCADRKQLDVLGVGAYNGEELVGLAGCSADCEGMWQIGVDVLPGCRRQGITSALTSRLAREILARDKVPFYCCAWSNIRSARNAVRSGFSPAWAELTVKPAAVADEMNRPPE